MSESGASSDPSASVETRATRWFADNVHVHDSALRHYLRRAFPSAQSEVEDLVQESYLRVWRSRAGAPLASAKAFLFTVARNVALDFVRRARISPVRPTRDMAVESVLDEKPDVVETLSRAERVRALTEALAHLPPRSREVLVLRRFRGYSQRETAQALGISEKTVEDHVTRGMKKLGAHLRACGFADHFP